MFRSKSKAEQVRDQVTDVAGNQADAAAAQLNALKERVAPSVAVAREAAKEAYDWSKPHVEHAKDWAEPRVRQGVHDAAPKLQGAVGGLAPRVDTARDRIVDDLLPKASEAIAALAAATATAREEASSVAERSTDAYAVLKGDKKAKRSKGKWILGFGLLAGAAAAAAVVFKKSAPKDDPWATPLQDPYTAPDSATADTAKDKVGTGKEKVAGAAATATEAVEEATDKAADAAEDAKN